ncbi:type II secretion system F family protein [Nanoarchaeota archaeon]
MKESPVQFVSRIMKLSLVAAFCVTLIVFMMLDKLKGRSLDNLFMSFSAFIVVFTLAFVFFFNSPSVYIRKREKEMDKEVLFAGRYILVKMESGVPFFNALTDASKSYGVSSKYFKEIVDDINTGTTIENALDNSVEYSASKKFKHILWQVANALKTGIDVTDSLRSVLEEITKDQLIEIQKYGKKLNSLAMFYMVVGVVMPSLGMAMFIILSSFVNIKMSGLSLAAVVVLLAFMQFMFLSMFKSIRPNVNL